MWAAGDVPHALSSPCTPESSGRTPSPCCIVCTHSCLPRLQADDKVGQHDQGPPPPQPSAALASPRPCLPASQPSPRLVPPQPGKAPTVCQPCPLVSLLPQPLLVIQISPPAPLAQMRSRDFDVTVSSRAWLSRQGSRKGEGPRLRYLPDDVVICGGRNLLLPLPPASAYGQSRYPQFPQSRRNSEEARRGQDNQEKPSLTLSYALPLMHSETIPAGDTAYPRCRESLRCGQFY